MAINPSTLPPNSLTPDFKTAGGKRGAVTRTYKLQHGGAVRDDGMPRTVDATISALKMIASAPGFHGPMRLPLAQLFCDLVRHGHALAFIYELEKEFNDKVDGIIEEFLV